MAAGKTVTFTAASDGTTRVSVDGRKFPLGVPVQNVSADIIERLKAMDGLSFDFDTKET